VQLKTEFGIRHKARYGGEFMTLSDVFGTPRTHNVRALILLLLAVQPLACGQASEQSQVGTGGVGVNTAGASHSTGGAATTTSSASGNQVLKSTGGANATGGTGTLSSAGTSTATGGRTADTSWSGGASSALTQAQTGGSTQAIGGTNTGGASTGLSGGTSSKSAGGSTSVALTTTTANGGNTLGGSTSFSTGGAAAAGGTTSAVTTAVALPGVTATRAPLELTQTDDYTDVPFVTPTQTTSFGPTQNAVTPISSGGIRFVAQCMSGNCGVVTNITEAACFSVAVLPVEKSALINLTAVNDSNMPTGFDWYAAGASGLTLKYALRDNGGYPVTAQFSVIASGNSTLSPAETLGAAPTTYTVLFSSLPQGSRLDAIDILLTTNGAQLYTFCIEDLQLNRPGQSTESTDYVPSSELLLGADYVKSYVKDCADFWTKTQAPEGGYYGNIDRTGAPQGYYKFPLSQWRLTYGFTRAFMLTGDERYLTFAEVALPLYQPPTGIGVPRTTAQWMYDGFEHNYSKVGLMAYCEATRDPGTCARVVVDELPPSEQQSDFNAVVDAFTTHLILLRLVRYDDPSVQAGFKTWAEALLANLATYSTKEEWYVMKLAWTLMRVSLVTGDARFSNAARGLLRPFGSRWTPLGSAELEWWAMEEFTLAPLLGYMMFGYVPERRAYLRAADGTASDFTRYFVDPEYGEVYRIASASGVLDTTKGTEYKSGYHSIEYGYFAYIYSSLFLRHEPFTLYYRLVASDTERTLVLTPIAIGDNQLRIKSVKLAGEVYTDFNAPLRSLHVPANVSGVFAVTFEGNEL
jgi:hypothetical protein